MQNDHFEFLNYPKIVSGQCALENLPSELDGYNAQKPLVITAKSMVQRGLVKKFIKAFYDSTTVIGGIYDEIRDYAGISQAREAARLYRSRGCDAIIALGNGPVVDLAKAVNVLVSENADDLRHAYQGDLPDQPLKPLIVVPGCSFNGMEATPTMTIDNRRVVSDALYPDALFLDPRITIGCCPECLAETGMIALSQAFEVITADPPNPMADAVARPALRLLAAHMVDGVKHPAEGNACLALANAAVMAAAAHSNIPPGMATLLAETLSRAAGISKAKLMSAILPAVMAGFQKQAAREELYLALAGPDRFAATEPRSRSESGLNMAMELAQSLKGTLPGSLQQLCIQKHLFDRVAGEASDDSSGRFAAKALYAVLIAANKDNP